MSRKKLQFKILTPEREVYANDVDQVTMPTQAGEITVLPDHAALVGLMKTGEIRVTHDGEVYPFAVDAGIFEITPGSNLTILAHNSESAPEIDIERAQAAYDRAEKAMQDKSDAADVDFARFQASLDKHMNRISIANKWRK